MRRSGAAFALAFAALLGSCAGEAGAPPPPLPPIVSPPPPAPISDTTTCSLRARAAFILGTLDEWYLFPQLLDRAADPASFSSPRAYLDALVAPARAAGRDRFFSGITTIAQENAFFEQGTSGGFGFRLGFDTFGKKLFVIEAFEGSAALDANLDRGTQILAIGESAQSLVPVETLLGAPNGRQLVLDALGPPDAGVTRVLSVRDQADVSRMVSLSKTNFSLTPVSERYGVQILEDGGQRIGYLNLRTFIDPAVPALRDAFTLFRNEGVRDLIIDLRYNGGGALSVAEVLGNLMARDLGGQLFYEMAFRPEKASFNRQVFFAPPAQAIAPRRIAFLTTGTSASASEVVINSLRPHFPAADIAIVGANTFGKPVGQSAFDLPACGDRLRPVTISLRNAAGEGDYFSGLAGSGIQTCQAFDDWRVALAGPGDDLVETGFGFIAGRACPSMASAALTASTEPPPAAGRGVLAPASPRTVAEREVPGLH